MMVLVTGGLGVNGVWVLREPVALGTRPVLENRLEYLLAEDIPDQLLKWYNIEC